ncbi:hypothetical protein ABIC09_005051 [Bradyrhizobium sp. S3.12.5]|uniref:hypothetical protein n=1 Tax=Bradyrhizobium sp. S3.12.5 TaxID=3156386 RepID=UPI003398F0C4
MGSFVRKFDLDTFEKRLTNSGQEGWWNDLLMLWRPSGQESGTHGLRLAIRNNYLNFYRLGQSIARVGLNRQKQPTLAVHAKYVLPEAERRTVGQEYVVLTGSTLTRPGGQEFPYEGIQTLKAWIDAAKDYTGDEKKFVDKLLSVPENDGVIDLEMALPAWGNVKTASRMDLVSIERVNGQLTVFFGEVKLFDDSRLRCRAALVRDEMPEVLWQLSIYRNYLAVPSHRARISEQYAEAAQLLSRLRDAADAIGQTRPLGRAILQSRHESLSVANLARLIVHNEHQRAWTEHRAKLEAERERVPMIELGAAGPLNLATTT